MRCRMPEKREGVPPAVRESVSLSSERQRREEPSTTQHTHPLLSVRGPQQRQRYEYQTASLAGSRRFYSVTSRHSPLQHHGECCLIQCFEHWARESSEADSTQAKSTDRANSARNTHKIEQTLQHESDRLSTVHTITSKIINTLQQT